MTERARIIIEQAKLLSRRRAGGGHGGVVDGLRHRCPCAATDATWKAEVSGALPAIESRRGNDRGFRNRAGRIARPSREVADRNVRQAGPASHPSPLRATNASASATTALSDSIGSSIREFKEFPDAWPEFHAGTRRLILSRFPYGVVYRFGPGRNPRPAAVAHLKRSPPYWRRRSAAKG